MRRYRIIAVSISLAVILCLGGVSLASGWVTHFSPVREHYSWSPCKFKSIAIQYYANNNEYTVDLLKTGHWIWVTGDWPVIGGQCFSINGDSTRYSALEGWFYPPIYSGEMATVWWNHEGRTHHKDGAAVSVYTLAGPWGPASVVAGWQTAFFPNGTFADYYFY